jgi:hypothetical protein
MFLFPPYLNLSTPFSFLFFFFPKSYLCVCVCVYSFHSCLHPITLIYTNGKIRHVESELAISPYLCGSNKPTYADYFVLPVVVLSVKYCHWREEPIYTWEGIKHIYIYSKEKERERGRDVIDWRNFLGCICEKLFRIRTLHVYILMPMRLCMLYFPLIAFFFFLLSCNTQ